MEPPPSGLAGLFAAVVAALLAFALAAGALVLMGGLFEGWVFLAAFAAAPAAVIALLPSGARLFGFGLGLLALGGTWFLDASGPHNPLIILPWIASCLAGSAVVADLCVRGLGRLGRRRSTGS